MARKLSPGDTVTLNANAAGDAKWKDDKAVVVKVEVFADIPGSVKLDRQLRGFSLWNIADLRVVKRAAKGA
jgi:hypothetical protein